MHIAILGNSGSGKSTLARALGSHLRLTPLDLDALAWEPGQVAVPRDLAAALADVTAACTAREPWVIEGCYAHLIGATLVHRPTLIFLDPGVETCLAHCRARPWEPHKYASKAEQDTKLAFLLDWVRAYDTRQDDMSRHAHQALFEAYAGPKHHLTAPPEPAFLATLLQPNNPA